MNESTTNSNEDALRWEGPLLLQGKLLVAKVTEHRRWWSIKGKSGVFNLSKKDYATLQELQVRVGTIYLEQALTIKRPEHRARVVSLFRALLNRG